MSLVVEMAVCGMIQVLSLTISTILSLSHVSNGCPIFGAVESYNPANNQWSLCPSMNEKKGSLAGAMLDSKIFAIGGGNGTDCFSDVEMYDANVGSWIPTQSMLEKVISSTQFTDGFSVF